MSGVLGIVASALPLLLVSATSVALAVVVARTVRDGTASECLRVEVRRLGETHRAVAEARAQAAERRIRA